VANSSFRLSGDPKIVLAFNDPRRREATAMTPLKKTPSTVVFLNALCIGIVCPLLYYIIELPDAIWIGVLFALNAAARLLGRPMLDRLERRMGLPRVLAMGQLIAAIGYGVLVIAGGTHLSHHMALGLIDLAVLLVGFSTANIPSPVSFTRGMGGSLHSAAKVAVIGATTGCAISAIFSQWVLRDNLMPMSDLFYGGIAAAGISACASALAIGLAERHDLIREAASGQNSAGVPIIILVAEAAFFMGICSSPLMQWETYWFHPAPMALLFGCVAMISVITSSLVRLNEKTAAQLGLFISAIGFFGLTTALWLSWVNHPFDGMRIGPWVICISGIPIGIGHGLLRSAFANLNFANLDRWGAITIAAAALFTTHIWAIHERDSIAIPGVIALMAGVMTRMKNPAGRHEQIMPPLPSVTDL
jgi:MFS family permease